MAESLRFAALIRVSTEKQERQGESLHTQRSGIVHSAKSMKGSIVEWYGGQEHATPGYEKVEVDRLLRDAKDGCFDAVIVAYADRWSRDNVKSKEGLEVFRQNKIRFFVGTSEYNLFDPQCRMFLGMSAEFGEFNALQQKQKSLLNRIERAKKGIPTCGKLPYGRTFDPETRQWGIDPAKKAIVADVAKRYLAGEQLARLADEYGVNHASLHRTLMQRCGKDWSIEFRADDLNIHETVAITIPPLLSEEVIAAMKKQAFANKTYQHGQAKNPYLFSGLVFCAGCGYAMFGQTNHGTKRYYRHAHAKRVRPCSCAKSWVRADDLEDVIVRHLFETFGNPAAIQKAIEEATPNLDKVKEYIARQERLDVELDKIRKSRATILRLISKGSLSEDEAADELTDLKSKERRHHTEQRRLRDSLENLPSPASITAVAEQVASRFKTKGKKRKREFVDAGHALKLKYINRDLDAMSWDDKRALAHMVFSGTTADGKRMGVYIKWQEEETDRRERRWEYEIRGHLIQRDGHLPLSTAEMSSLFSFDGGVFNEQSRLVHSASH